jgi:hypothetical protein
MNKSPINIATSHLGKVENTPVASNQPTPQQIRDAKRTYDNVTRHMAAKVIDSLFEQFNFGARKGKKLIRSDRKIGELVAEVRQFYSARPRPWRSHQNRRRVRAALERRRVAAIKRDKEINASAGSNAV